MNQNADASVILRVASAVHSTLDIDTVFRRVLASVQEGLRAEACSLILVDEERGKLVFRGATGEKAESIKQFELDPGQGIAGWVVQHGEPVVTSDAHSDPRHMAQVDGALDFSTRAMITVPLCLDARVIGALQVLNPLDGPEFGPNAPPTMEAVAEQVAVAIRNAKLYAAARQDKEGLEEVLGLRDRLVGESPAMKSLLAQVAELSQSDKPVLLAGEPGAGKTLFAHAIHEAGPRRRDLFTVVRCEEMSEAELAAALFDRWQGGPGLLSRPGSVYLREAAGVSPAVAQRLAAGAGDAAARVLAGTSRFPTALAAPAGLPECWTQGLEAAVVEVPPLRERPEDIPPLAGYFVRRANARLGRRVQGLDHEALRFFMNRLWPGNVRELEDLVSRSVAAAEDAQMIRMATLSKVADVGGMAGLASAAVGLERWGRTASPEDLFAALRSPDPSERSAALDEIGRTRPAGAADQIAATVLRDSQGFIRLRAAQLLGELGEPQTLEALLGLLPQESDAEATAAGLTSLGQLAASAANQRERARASLLLYLRDANPSLRLSAARALANLGAEDAREPLKGMVHDEHAGVRCAAALALHRFGEPDALDRLKAELKSEEAPARAAACEALAETGKAVAELIDLMDHDPDPDVRVSATDALGRSASAEAVKPLLYKIDDPLLRMGAIRSLGRLCSQTDVGTTECVAALLGVVMDEKSSMVRRAALNALGQVAAPAAASRLSEFLHDSKVASSAIAALGRIGGADAEDALIPLLQPGPFCVDAINAIAGMGTARSVGPLVSLLSADDYAAQQAAQALTAIGAPAEDALIAGLADERKRHWCARCLGALRSAKAAPRLLAIYDDSEAAQHALAAIGEEGLPEVVELAPRYPRAAAEVCLKVGASTAPALLRAFREDDPVRGGFAEKVLVEIGAGAADAVADALLKTERAAGKARLAGVLARVGHASHAAAIEPLLDDASAEVRRAAIEALGALGGAHAVDTLVSRAAAKGGDRIACIEALRRIGGPQALKAVSDALDAPDWTVRRAAVEALAGFPAVQAAERLRRAAEDADDRVAAAAVEGAEAMDLLDLAALKAQALDAAAPPSSRRQAAKTLRRMAGLEAKHALAEAWSKSPSEEQAAIIEESAREGAAAIRWLAPLVASTEEICRDFARRVAAGLTYDPFAVKRCVSELNRSGLTARDLLRSHLAAHRPQAAATLEAMIRNTTDTAVRLNVIQLLDDLQHGEA